MAAYRVTVPITIVVEIDDQNEVIENQPMLSGDSLATARRRAVAVVMSPDRILERKRLGIRKFLIQGGWETLPATQIDPSLISRPFSANAEIASGPAKEDE